MKKYKLTDEGKEILTSILMEMLIGIFAIIGLVLTIALGLFLYCIVI